MTLGDYDKRIALLHHTAPLYPMRGYLLANHAPMALEALETMAQSQHAQAFLARALPDLAPMPIAGSALAEHERGAALGKPGRVADWVATFEQDLAQRGVRATLGDAIEALHPGVIAASLHGLIRTFHALRALSREETPTRLRELAHGLATWASSHQRVPGIEQEARDGEGALDALAWLETLPILPESSRRAGLLHEVVLPLDHFEPFAAHVRALGAFEWTPEVSVAAAHWAADRVVRDPLGLTGHVHGVTVARGLELMRPWVHGDVLSRLARSALISIGAIHCAAGSPAEALPERATRDALEPEALRARAVATLEDHAIKLTEAALREPSSPLLRLAAERWIERVSPVSATSPARPSS